MATISKHCDYKFQNLFDSANKPEPIVVCLCKLILEFDPSCLQFTENHFEYLPEAEEIVRLWDECNGLEETRTLVGKVMMDFLGDQWIYKPKQFNEQKQAEFFHAIESLRLVHRSE